MGILNGIEGFGLFGLSDINIFGEKKEEKTDNKVSVDIHQFEPSEADFIYQKSYDCPCCGEKFESATVKAGKLRIKSNDWDLRPVYDTLDPVKYDAVMCPHCGYAAATRYFHYLTPPQARLVHDNISINFMNGYLLLGDFYTYDEAIERFKLATASTVAKRGRYSERAYLSLHLAWLLRGKREELDKKAATYMEMEEGLKAEEDEYLKMALDGFIRARKEETFPICGMDSKTLDYLQGALCAHFGRKEAAAEYLDRVLESSAGKSLRDKAKHLKENMSRSA